MTTRKTINVTRGELITGLVVLAILLVLATLLVEDVLTADASQPPGCSEKDKNVPGCRPLGTDRLTQSALALATVILSASAAVFVAILTARTTDRRQERALSAEEGRHREMLRTETKIHERSLTDERARLEEQLSHDRRLADRAELRVLLDQISKDLAEIIDAYTGAQATIAVGAEDELEKGSGSEKDQLARKARDQEAIVAVSQRASGMVGNAGLLVTRLGPAGDLPAAYIELRSALNEWWKTAGECIDDSPAERIVCIESLDDRIGDAYSSFTKLSWSLVGSDL